jgi:hypothetical protein
MSANNLERRLLRLEHLHKPAEGLDAILAALTDLELIDVIAALTQEIIDRPATPADERLRLIDDLATLAEERKSAEQWVRYDPHPPRPIPWLLQRLTAGTEPPGGEAAAASAAGRLL